MTNAPGPGAANATPSAAAALAALEAAARVLAGAQNVLVIDWPSRDVPASLAFAGFTVLVKGGPGPADYNSWHIEDGEPRVTATGPRAQPRGPGLLPPPGESGQARDLAIAAGLAYVDDVYIADAVRARGTLV
jgi:hypothetical protein